MLSHGYVAIKEKYLVPVLYKEGASVTVYLSNSGAALCSQWGIPTEKTAFGCVTSVTESQHLPSPYSQPAVLYIQSLTLIH
jgi:hypothetical protein